MRSRDITTPSFLALGLLAIGACTVEDPAPRQASFDQARAWRDLESIVALGPRPPGSPELEKTREYIERELRAAGLTPVREPFDVKPPPGFKSTPPVESFAMANVYADFAAQDQGAETVILGTHIDTKIHPQRFVGANDSGSGTAVLLELARVIASGGPRSLNYRFLFIDGEESLRWDWADTDNTYGSRHHASKLVESRLAERVRAFVLLDLVGDKDLVFLRETYSDRRLNDLFFKAADGIGLGKHMLGARQEAKDDHLSFMAVGIPSIDLIDFDYGPDNSWWHTVEDTLDKCSAESLGITGRIVLAALPEIERSFRRK
ncbi:MAG: M28 family peptidase [Planctomycetota bacterium]